MMNLHMREPHTYQRISNFVSHQNMVPLSIFQKETYRVYGRIFDIKTWYKPYKNMAIEQGPSKDCRQ